MSRCLALADALSCKGQTSAFRLFGKDSGWAARIEARGHESIGPNVSTAGTEFVLIDRYDVKPYEVEAWRRAGTPVAIMDDFGTVPESWADLIISPGAAPGSCGHRLAGPKFALLDPEYARPPSQLRAGGEHVMVSFGRRDSVNATGLALQALAELVAKGTVASITVALGGDAPHLGAVRAQCDEIGGVAQLVVDADGLIDAFDEATLIIGAGGVSLFERMARARPSVTITLADNQQPAAAMADAEGATAYLGDMSEASVRKLAGHIDSIMSDASRRVSMARRARELVDGRGANRVAAALIAVLDSTGGAMPASRRFPA